MNFTPHDYIWLGTLAATIFYLRKDVNGLGAKTRKMIAETIIQNREHPDFANIVRRLLG